MSHGICLPGFLIKVTVAASVLGDITSNEARRGEIHEE